MPSQHRFRTGRSKLAPELLWAEVGPREDVAECRNGILRAVVEVWTLAGVRVAGGSFPVRYFCNVDVMRWREPVTKVAHGRFPHVIRISITPWILASEPWLRSGSSAGAFAHLSLGALLNLLFLMRGEWGSIGDYFTTQRALRATVGDDLLWADPQGPTPAPPELVQ
jgi:hypothetical protein